MLETTPQHPLSEVISSRTDTALQQPQAQQGQPPGSKMRLNKFINDRTKAQDYRGKAERPSGDYKHLGNGCCLHRAQHGAGPQWPHLPSHIFSATQPPFCGGRSSHRPAPKRAGRCLHKGSSSSFPRHLISFMKPQQLLVRQCRARPLSSAVAAPSLHAQLPYRSPGCELPKELQAQPNPIAELI